MPKTSFKIVLIFLIFLLLGLPVKAGLLEEIEAKIQTNQEKIQAYEKEVQIYQAQIEAKQVKISSLKNQITIINSRINKLEAQINLTQGRIDQLSLEVLETDYKIGERKKVLTSLIRTINDNDRETIIETILEHDNFSDLFNQLQYLKNLQAQLHVILDELKRLKKELENQKFGQEDLKNKLRTEKEVLQNQKTSKRVLLTKTRGQEKKYQQLLARSKKQKESLLGDLKELERQKAVELARLKALQEKPSSGMASTSWYFNQNDEKWQNINIGFSSSTVGDYGCAISSVAMVFKYYGLDIDPGRLAQKPIYFYDLIKWPEEYKFLKLTSPKGHIGVDWQRIDAEISRGHPVIIFIKAGNLKKGHYVVIHSKDDKGKYVIHDPYFGPNTFLSSTRQNLELLYDRKTSIDQMIIYK